MTIDLLHYIFLCIKGPLTERADWLAAVTVDCDLVGFIAALQMVYNLFFFVKLYMAERTGIIFVVR